MKNIYVYNGYVYRKTSTVIGFTVLFLQKICTIISISYVRRHRGSRIIKVQWCCKIKAVIVRKKKKQHNVFFYFTYITFVLLLHLNILYYLITIVIIDTIRLFLKIIIIHNNKNVNIINNNQ